MDDNNGRTPGPEPERLKLPHEDWKEAVREAVGGDRSADEEDDEEGETDATEQPAGR